MRTDPIPDDFTIVDDSDSTVVAADSDGIDCSVRMNWFESKTGMIWVLSKCAISAAGLVLHLRRQFGEQFPELRCGVRDHNLFGDRILVFPARSSANASSARSESRSGELAKS